MNCSVLVYTAQVDFFEKDKKILIISLNGGNHVLVSCRIEREFLRVA